MRQLARIDLPNSLGLFYAAMTAYLGFKVNEDEYKVMGMAGYGKPVFADEMGSRRRQERIETLNQFCGKTLVAGKLSESQRTVPGADLLIDNVLGIRVRTDDEMFGHAFADFGGGSAGGPVGEVVGLGGGRKGKGKKRQNIM